MRKGLLGVLGYCLFGAAPLLAQTFPSGQGSPAQQPVTLGATIPTSDPAPVVPEQHIRVQFNTEAPPLPPVSLTTGPALTSKQGVFVPATQELGTPMRDSPFAEPACNADRYRIWVGADYLLWRIKNGQTPPLVTTGDPTLPPGGPVPGALGSPGTIPLFGGGMNYGNFSGMRLTLGSWLGAEGVWGVEASTFALERRSTGFAAASDGAGNPPIYVPFFNVGTGREGSLAIADPNFGFAGRIAVASSSRLWGTELNLVRSVSNCGPLNVALIGGFRYMDLRENLRMSGEFNDLIFDVQTRYTESFATRNQFYGGQLGAKAGYQQGRLGIDVLGKVALGSTHQIVDANGSITQSGAGAFAPGTFPGGGVFVQPTNLGRQTRDAFSVIPQVQVKLGYDILPRLKATVGYDFTYWSNVVRPGDQIDRNLNVSQTIGGALVGPASPAPQFNRSDFFAHGLMFGLEFRY